MIAAITIPLLTRHRAGRMLQKVASASGSEVGMTENRVIAVVPSFGEFQRICETLAPDDIVVQHASCLLEAVLAHLHAQVAESAEAMPEKIPGQGPVIVYDADPSPQNPQDWREALRQLLRVHSEARVLFLSRVADEEMWIEVLKTGGHDLLSKPLSETELRQAVRRAFLRNSNTLATAA
jgi:FixJ family two-component response regulator